MMNNLIFISILLMKYINGTSTSYLKEYSYVKNQMEKHTKINKGIWTRTKNRENIFKRPSIGEFIFDLDPADVGNPQQINYDNYNDNIVQSDPVVTNYIERSKRSSNDERKNKNGSVATNCDGGNCIKADIAVRPIFTKSKIISTLKPASVFNEYPYEIAVLLNDNQLDDLLTLDRKPQFGIKGVNTTNNKNSINLRTSKNTVSMVGNVITYNDTENTESPKTRKISDFENEIIKKVEYSEEINKNTERSVFKPKNRNVFNKDDIVWYQNAPTLNKKIQNGEIKTKFNDKAVIKILSMLSKTFKKIMIQQNNIKQIHTKIHHLDDEISKKIVDITKKFDDIENQHANIVAVGKYVKQFEAEFNAKNKYFKTKDKEFTSKLLEFESQQKKFLTQQRQFYNIQKLILAQNEKINLKQNFIANTQRIISQRQNNFAAILRKGKEIYMGSKNSILGKLTFTTMSPIIITTTTSENQINFTTTTTPATTTTESVKINLFSVPTFNKLINQDSVILQEKDRKTIDDLVYKFYFNNTLIDNIMKTKVFPAFDNNQENSETIENAKIKRKDDDVKATILLPINTLVKLSRSKRWIRRSKSKPKRNLEGKMEENNFNDEKPISLKSGNNEKILNTGQILIVKKENNPFLIMAKSFCNEIRQNATDQVLNWCIEKALRRLQYIDLKIPKSSETSAKGIYHSTLSDSATELTGVRGVNTFYKMEETPITDTNRTPLLQETTIKNKHSQSEAPATIYFPDNDELELNLKQYELIPDREGTVYYEGSLHASDIVSSRQSEGYSDIMPGMDSNSRVTDPRTLSLLALRRHEARRLGEHKRKPYD